jgi:flagellar motor switch protein FliN
VKVDSEGSQSGGGGGENEVLASTRAVKNVPIKIDPEVFGDVSVDVVATLGRGTMRVSALVDLTDGTVIDLDTPINGLVDLSLNGRVVARGEIVAVGDQFGVKVTEIVAKRK